MSKSILGMPTFRAVLQGEKQPNTELFLRIVPFILRCLLEWWKGEKRELLMGGGEVGKLIGLQ